MYSNETFGLYFYLNRALLKKKKIEGDYKTFGPYCLLLDYITCHMQ